MSLKNERTACIALTIALSLALPHVSDARCEGEPLSAPDPTFVAVRSNPTEGFVMLEFDLDVDGGAPVEIGRAEWSPLLQLLRFTEAVADVDGFMYVVDAYHAKLGGFELETGELQTWSLPLGSDELLLTLDLDPRTGRLFGLVTDFESTWLMSVGAGGARRVGAVETEGHVRQDESALDAANRRLLGILLRNDGLTHVVGFDLEDGGIVSDAVVPDVNFNELRCIAFDDERDRLLAVTRSGASGNYLVELDPETGELSEPLVDLGSRRVAAFSSCEVEPGGGRFVTSADGDLVVVDLESNVIERSFPLSESRYFLAAAFGFTGRQAGGCAVSVDALLDELRQTTESLVGPLHRGVGRSLDAKLQAADAGWQSCQADTACQQVGAYRHEVAAMERSGRLDSVAAATLDLGAGWVQGALSDCSCVAAR